MCLARLVERLRDVGARLPGRAGRRALRELDDWICCGATAAHSLNHKLAVGPAGPQPGHCRARRPGANSWPPARCVRWSCCKARGALAASAELSEERSPRSSSSTCNGSTQVLNLIQVLQKIGLEEIEREGRPAAERSSARPATTAACLTRPPRDAAVRRLRAAQHRWKPSWRPWAPSRSSGTTRPSAAGRA